MFMSFPITYQFMGSEGAKWKLVGNAVCPYVSRALAMNLLARLGIKPHYVHRRKLPRPLGELPNLNTFSPKAYDTPPQRKKLARFRSHPFKAASMTVALANYDVLARGTQADGKWRCYVTYGIGEGYKVQSIDVAQLEEIRNAVKESSPTGAAFVEHVTNGFSEKIPPALLMQELYERNIDKLDDMLNPNLLLEETRDVVLRFSSRDAKLTPDGGLFLRSSVPTCQLYALFAVCHIVSMTKAKQGTSSGR